ncbi:unnamed protein product [Phytomonas sp. Hart1]|nr:unnamed protein product [Phytomonas sp. Hart1]|eukprot:CCW66931.1 unnamed protein product [Phytomonas sp. isolate Hart1]
MSYGGVKILPTNMMRRRQANEENADIATTADRFRDRFEKAAVADRKAAATTMVNEYYDMVTDIYEYGWGQSFHFAPCYAHETFYESIIRHEFYLALRGGFKEGDQILDVGCGVGGPARNMVRLAHCHITGINNNAYQISRARAHDAAFGMTGHINYVKADFCQIAFPDNSFDGAYAIEATCHAKEKLECYREIYRLIKPGGRFVVYEWCITDQYDPANPRHREIKHYIELGDSLPDLESTQQALAAMRAAGFVVEDSCDLAEKFAKSPVKNVVWYDVLKGDYSTMRGFRSTAIGRFLTAAMCRVMEFVGLAPKGVCKTLSILEKASVNLVEGGEKGIFTPCFFMCGRKPIDKKTE